MLVFKLGGTANLPAPDSAPSLPPPSPLPNAASETTIRLGEQKYQRYCAACHGDVAVSGGVLPDLRYSGTLDNDAWFSVVLGGILQPKGMVSFVKELSRRDASDIRSYVIFRRNQSVAANKIPNKN
jgi:mono/diheme cytochrome c family protein